MGQASACAGLQSRYKKGVTLIEMLMVVTLIALMAAVSYPSVTAGVDSLRINGAADSIASLINLSLARTERRQAGVEFTVLPAEQAVVMLPSDPSGAQRIEMPPGVVVEAVYPLVPGYDPRLPRRFFLLPGGAPPRITIVLLNGRGSRRIISVDPISGTPLIRRLGPGESM
ncbi:MAG: prepilin-type N-terminal cleavage/methylation domain-containing protein [Bryobacteraceae bacterium]